MHSIFGIKLKDSLANPRSKIYSSTVFLKLYSVQFYV